MIPVRGHDHTVKMNMIITKINKKERNYIA